MDEQVGGRAVIDSIRENLPQLREALRELPGVIRNLSELAADGSLSMRIKSAELEELRDQIRRQQRQRFLLGAGATAFVSGTLLLGLGSVAWLGWALIVTGAAGLFAARPG